MSDLGTLRRELPVAFLLGTLVLGVGLPLPAAAQEWATVQFSRQLQDQGEAEVRVRYGSGQFSLSPLATDHFYRVRLRYDESSFQPIHEYRPGRLVVGVEGTARRTRIRRGDSGGELDLELSTRVPMRLHLEFGAVQADVDLGGLRLRTLDLSTGASDSQIRVSAPNPDPMEYARFQVGAAAFNATDLGRLNAREIELEAGVGDVKLEFSGLQRDETRVRAKMGLGSLEIRVPRGVGIRMDRSTFLTSVTAPDLTRRGDSWYSSDWETAERRVILEVEAVVGSVTVARTDR
jgi:hypothetical protein